MRCGKQAAAHNGIWEGLGVLCYGWPPARTTAHPVQCRDILHPHHEAEQPPENKGNDAGRAPVAEGEAVGQVRQAIAHAQARAGANPGAQRAHERVERPGPAAHAKRAAHADAHHCRGRPPPHAERRARPDQANRFPCLPMTPRQCCARRDRMRFCPCWHAQG